MGIYSRSFLGLFLTRLAWILALVTLFLVLTTFLGFLSRNPYVPPLAIAAGLPDLLLLLLPIYLPFSALLAALWFVRDVRRQRGFLWIHLAGRDPRRYQIPLVLAGLTLALFCWPLYSSVLPRVRFSAKRLRTAVRDDASSLALRLAEDREFLKGFSAGFAAARDDALTDFYLLAGEYESPLAVTAQRAKISLSEDGVFFVLDLQDGRLLRLDDGGHLDLNSRFDRLELRLDARRLGGPPLTAVRDLANYTDAEIGRLPTQIRTLFRHGFRPSGEQRRRAAGGGPMRAIRIQSALMPLLVIVMVVVFLGTHRPEPSGRITVAVIVFCLGVLLPAVLVLEVAARDGKLPNSLVSLSPTILIAVIVAIRFGLEALPRRRRRTS